MTRYLVTIEGPRSRNEAHAVVAKAPLGTRVEIKAAKRTNDQNSLMWVLLTKLSLSLPWDGQKRTPDRWKRLFLDALRVALDEDEETIVSLDGLRRVPTGDSSSDLSKDEMTILIELILKFGAERGIDFDAEREAA